MASQDPEKDENGGQQPEDEAGPSPESEPKPEPSAEKETEPKPNQFKLLFSKDLEYVGLSVFAITAVATIIFVGAFNFVPPIRGD